MNKKVDRYEKLAVSLIVLNETEKALLVTEGLEDDEGRKIKHWLPKSQIEFDASVELNVVQDILVPRWLIEEKGLTSGD